VSRRSFLLCLLLILGAGMALRLPWLRADPPVTSVGVVWHDEGAWVHNARNRVLFDTWRTDDWNPVFIAPVFTALEYASFELLGVGLWQARVVPVVSGLAAVALLMLGLSALGGRQVALVGGALLSTNYIFVMWNRAALMESTMTTFIVAGWASYAASARRPVWALAAGAAATLAWFTKAAAAFFVAALVFDATITLALGLVPALRHRLRVDAPGAAAVRAAWLTLAGIAAAAAAIGLLFVLPYWDEYRFYNWQMSVTRKPSYAFADLVTRASWIPVVQDFFSRMWLVVVGACLAVAGIVARWRTAAPGERLLVLWILIGLAELTVHDSGNERRYVMFIPALVALAALLAAGGSAIVPAPLVVAGRRTQLLAVPLVLLLGYLVFGSLVRIPLLDEVRAGEFSTVVRLSAALAALAAGLLVWRWRAVTGWLATTRIQPAAAGVLLAIAVTWNLAQYAWWAGHRTTLNYEASVALGTMLPPGTPVQGKLANGLALDNGIRPIFIGNGFGNYDDRLARDDVRYILTYTQPDLGYESGQDGLLIVELLARYPNHRIVAQYPVEETAGPDVAALFEKRPEEPRARD
jgi:4-amino-4-deoxy-L-arabinose transferase-like glycosyltransferase